MVYERDLLFTLLNHTVTLSLWPILQKEPIALRTTVCLINEVQTNYNGRAVSLQKTDLFVHIWNSNSH